MSDKMWYNVAPFLAVLAVLFFVSFFVWASFESGRRAGERAGAYLAVCQNACCPTDPTSPVLDLYEAVVRDGMCWCIYQSMDARERHEVAIQAPPPFPQIQ